VPVCCFRLTERFFGVAGRCFGVPARDFELTASFKALAGTMNRLCHRIKAAALFTESLIAE
jgi:hypothetical protein